ncbi:peptidoglycan-binding domain-containing protein [Streptomyces sp. NPDC091278]|uniref:peptidoglycan recognition protein family protein n=1 Tax=Streptomyces sp. NPDC091278 TaxID=3155301 RepID=UPI003450FD26
MTFTITSRKSWGAKPWTSTPDTVPLSERREFFIHYDGAHPVSRTGPSVPKAIERAHLAQKWSGIGYNFVIDQAGTVFEGRGWGLQSAHCPGHNRSGIGVQIAVGGNQKPSDAALRAARALYDEACRRTGRTLAKKGHKDGIATLCPGGTLYAWVKAGMPAPAGSSKPKPPAPTPASKIVALNAAVRPGVRHAQVRDLQQLLIKTGHGPIKGAVTDLYGPETQRAVARWHDRNPAYRTGQHDPKIGPRGFVALQKQAGRR